MVLFSKFCLKLCKCIQVRAQVFLSSSFIIWAFLYFLRSQPKRLRKAKSQMVFMGLDQPYFWYSKQEVCEGSSIYYSNQILLSSLPAWFPHFPLLIPHFHHLPGIIWKSYHRYQSYQKHFSLSSSLLASPKSML